MRSSKNGMAFFSWFLRVYVDALLNSASEMSCFSVMSCFAIFRASSFLLDFTAFVMAAGVSVGVSGVAGC